MILFEVSSSQPDALLAGKHRQSMRIDSSCTFKGIVGNTLGMKTNEKTELKRNTFISSTGKQWWTFAVFT